MPLMKHMHPSCAQVVHFEHDDRVSEANFAYMYVFSCGCCTARARRRVEETHGNQNNNNTSLWTPTGRKKVVDRHQTPLLVRLELLESFSVSLRLTIGFTVDASFLASLITDRSPLLTGLALWNLPLRGS